jgi:hypothetical protein
MGLTAFLCMCCDNLRSLYYKDMFSNLVKYNSSEITRLIGSEPEDELIADSINWRFDEEVEFQIPPLPAKMEVVVEQPRSLGVRPKDRAVQDNAVPDNAVLDNEVPDNAVPDRATGDFFILHRWIIHRIIVE